MDFTQIIDRHGIDALAVDDYQNTEGALAVPVKEGYDVIPMWVADMNLPTAPSIQEAMLRRVSHPMFGYFSPREEYYAAILNWQNTHNGANDLRREHLLYHNGVLGGVISAVNAFSLPGDAVLLHSPTYVGFTSRLTINGRKIVLSPLKKDEQGVWRMDFVDMEQKLRDHHIHLAIFCSPHNPTGRVWERWELEQAMELYRKYDCVVLSDEIWSDLLLDGHTHIPTQSVSEDAKNRTIAYYAPSKTFNLAGLVGAYSIAYDPLLLDRLHASSEKACYNEMNVLSMHALIGAYSEEGNAWLDEVREVLSENARLACEALNSIDGVSVARPEGTYMLFLDCREWCKQHGKTLDELLQAGWAVGVIWMDGRPFFEEYGIRLNVASPTARVAEAIRRLCEEVFA